MKAQSSKRRTEEADWFFCFRAAAALWDGSTLLMIGGRGFSSLWRHKHTAGGEQDHPVVISNTSGHLTVCQDTHPLVSAPARVCSRTHGDSQSASGYSRDTASPYIRTCLNLPTYIRMRLHESPLRSSGPPRPSRHISPRPC